MTYFQSEWIRMISQAQQISIIVWTIIGSWLVATFFLGIRLFYSLAMEMLEEGHEKGRR